LFRLLSFCSIMQQAVRLDSRVAIDNIAHWAKGGCHVPNAIAG
jgi:hypothetical protein